MSSTLDPRVTSPSPAPTGRDRSRLGFVLRMAWRDSRAARARLLLFTTCIAVGIAALVAVGSFGKALERAIDEQARGLLGADLSIGSRVRFTPEHESFLQSLGGEQAREIAFSSMVVFPERQGTRLTQVRALEGGFPFYGRMETTPVEAEARFRAGDGVLVEESLLLQFGAQVGDRIRIGSHETTVIGALVRVPGESIAFSTIAPRVYLPMSTLPATGLLREGSLARYRILYRLPPDTDAEALVREHRTRLDELRLSVTTVADRKEDLGQAMRNLDNFLSLVAFLALLLGGLGMASAIHAHVQQKIPTVAILRCLGAPIWTAFAVYLTQAAALGVIGAGLGAAGGVLVQRVFPRVVGDFIPVPVTTVVSWVAVGEAALLGFLVCVLFALLPLAAVRAVSPMAVLRAAFEPVRRADALRRMTLVLLLVALVLFALSHTRRWQEGLGFAGGVLVAFAVLALVARLVIRAAARLRTASWPFVIRQGLASVHRPQNRTLLLVVSLGLGTFLLLTLQLLQTTLTRELVSDSGAGRANAILFDIQADQREGVKQLVQEQGLPVLDQAPIVTMRLREIRGKSVEELLADRHTEEEVRADSETRDGRPPTWALRREFRSTYHAELRDSEKLTAGTWVARADPTTDIIPISVEEGIAKELGIGLGDEVEWDVQGVPLRTRVSSLREVDWRRVQPNFFVVFPDGPLNDAPAFHVLVTRIESPEQSARLQRAVVERFPNVSAIDITLVLRTLDQVLGKVAFAIRFMALFTVATGLLVLVATVLSGRYQRVRESILLRVLGASRRQVLRILLVEYAVLGLLASIVGVILAIAAAGALAVFVFEVPFTPPLLPPLLTVILVTVLTVITGWAASRGVTTHPPLEILRHET